MFKPAGAEELPDALQIAVATFGALLIGALYMALPEPLTVGPRWLLLVVEAPLLALPLIAAVFLRRALEYRVARGLALGLLAVVTIALVGSIMLLVTNLGSFTRGLDLLRTAAILWSINVLVFAVWYWELDGNGPVSRLKTGHQATDFQFPQQLRGNPSGWAPGFVDYLFLAFCSATALSPADTMPLTRKAKLMMMGEAILSMLIIVLLAARAVNLG